MNNYVEDKKVFSKLGIILLIGSLVFMGVQYGTLAVVKNIPSVVENFNVYFLIMMGSTYVIAYPIFILLFKLVPVRYKGEKKTMKLSHIFIAFFICYSAGYLCNQATTKVTSFLSELMDIDVISDVSVIMSYANPAVTFLFVVILAPIMEELIFRKMLIDRTAQYGDVMASVISGLTFGLFHGNISQFFYAFLLGICFGYIYAKTRNIKHTIILHMLVNSISWIGTLVLRYSGYLELIEDLNKFSGDVADNTIITLLWEHAGGILLFFGYALLILIMVIAGLILFFTKKDKMTFFQGVVVVPKGERMKVMLLNLGMILYLGFWIVMIILDLVGI